MVELYTSILDRRGRPVEDITADELTVTEEGVEQEILRIESVVDLPIHAGVLLDTSTSMMPMLQDAERAALEFFETVLTPKDRAAVITFNDQPQLEVPFTNSLQVLAGGLAGLTAEGETAFHDSLVYALYYFSGLARQASADRHQRRRRLEQPLQLRGDPRLRSPRRHRHLLDRSSVFPPGSSTRAGSCSVCPTETGGRHFFIDNASEMSSIYNKIEEEIRSQYLVVYQSSADGTDFREVKIEATRPGVQAKTIPGYYP